MALIVASGVASEYVLGPLCQFLSKRGHEVHCFNFSTPDDIMPAINRLAGRDAIYLCSSHHNFSSRVSESIYKVTINAFPSYRSGAEIMPVLRPAKSVYVPHDLLMPYGIDRLDELYYLGLYDHIFAIAKDKALESFLPADTQINVMGWIKNHTDMPVFKAPSTFPDNKPKVIFFFADLSLLVTRHGVEETVNRYRSILADNVLVTYPPWPGLDLDRLVELLLEAGCAGVVPWTVEPPELIKWADVVVCNSPSSVCAEASIMGRTVISLLTNDCNPISYKIKSLSRISNVLLYDYQDRNPIPEALYHQAIEQKRESAVKTFSFEKAERILLSPSKTARKG